MLFKLLLALASIVIAPFRGHVDPDQPFEATPYGPQNWAELAHAHEALYGELDDIRYTDDEPKSAGINDPERRWPGKTVVYYLAPEVRSDVELVKLIKKAMDHYKSKTCIKFREAKNDKTYVRIFKEKGCYSNLGKLPQASQPQNLSLGAGCNFFGTVVHELGHTIGLYHEHQRSDRDKYINYYPQNVAPDTEQNFEKYEKEKELTFGLKYDYTSIMHYGECAFSKDSSRCPIDRRLRTMEAKDGKTRLLEPYDRDGLNKKDIALVKKLYNC